MPSRSRWMWRGCSSRLRSGGERQPEKSLTDCRFAFFFSLEGAVDKQIDRRERVLYFYK
jgi:hypothetical protein